jgi:hypothetical protein
LEHLAIGGWGFANGRSGGAFILSKKAARSRSLDSTKWRAGPQQVLARRSPPLPAPSSPTPSPSTAATNEPDEQEEYQRANGGVDDCSQKARAKVNTESRQQPATDEGADNTNDQVANEAKPGASHDLAG